MLERDAVWSGNKSPGDGVHKEERSGSQLLRFLTSRSEEMQRDAEREASGNDQYYDNSSLSRFILSRPPPLPLSIHPSRHFCTEGEKPGDSSTHPFSRGRDRKRQRRRQPCFGGAGVAFRLPGATGVIRISTWERREGWLGFCPGGKMLSLLCGG